MRMPVAARFWSKVEKTDGCWAWCGGCDTGGYGYFRVGRQMRVAHRIAFEMEVGPIPDGMQLDHLCRNRACVNPAHLEPVTGTVNRRRGISVVAVNYAKTECRRGHPFDAANTYVYRNRSGVQSRICRACHRERQRGYQLRAFTEREERAG